jgi:hypothetical protein
MIRMEAPLSYEVLATLLVGMATFAVAWKQHHATKEQIRLELFEKRHKVYFATKVFIAKVIQSDKVETDDLLEFWRETSDSRFLFPQGIQAILGGIESVAGDKRMYRQKWEHARHTMNSQPAVNEFIDAESRATKELGEIMSRLEDSFMPYLDFREFRASTTRRIFD